MTSSAILVSGADRHYFKLLANGLLPSVRNIPAYADLPVAVLDLGLAPDQSAALSAAGVQVVAPGWDLRVPGDTPIGLQAMTARPHLPRHLPGYDIYIWIDADAWVQDRFALDYLLGAVDERPLAITAEAHRAYHPMYRRGTFRQWHRKNLKTLFGGETADAIGEYPILNTGVFAMRADAPHWEHWAELLALSMAIGTFQFYSEQTALNVAVRVEQLAHHQLPSSCNWLCNRALPACSADGRVLYEPTYPHQKLGIVHLTANTKEGTRQLVVHGSDATVVRSLVFQGAVG